MSDWGWTSTTTKDALVRIEDTLWIRLSAVESVRYSQAFGSTMIVLACGLEHATALSVDEVVEKLADVVKRQS